MQRVPLLPHVRIPVPLVGSGYSSRLPDRQPDHEEVLFYLKRTTDGRGFFECTSLGCPGCGCPSFEVKDMMMPAWALIYLSDHVRIYHTKEGVMVYD